MYRFLFSLLTLAALAAPCIAQSQNDGMYSAYVIHQGASVLSPTAIRTVAHTLRPGLIEWPKSLKPMSTEETWMSIEPEAIDLAGARLLNLSVYFTADAQPAEEEIHRLWELARVQLEADLNRVTAMAAESEQRRLRREIDRLTAQHSPEAATKDLIEQLAKLQSESAGSEGNFAEGIAEAFSKQRELQLRDAGVEARREATERRIDELRKRADASRQEDTVVGELDKLVDIHRKKLDAVAALYAVGSPGGTAVKVAQAESELATALVELAKAKREAAERAGGGELRALNDQLSKLLVEAAEIDAQRKELGKIITDLRAAIHNSARAIAEAASLESKLQTLRTQQAEYDARLRDLRRELDEQQPEHVTLQPLTDDEAVRNDDK